MRTTERTNKRITIEVTKIEISQKGFDSLWDEVREIYPENLYDVESVEDSDGGKIVTIKLKFKKK